MTLNLEHMFGISGQVAIVTGGATGLGLAIVEVLAAAGAKVAIFDINRDVLHSEEGRLKSQGFDVLGIRIDVADPASLEAGVEKVVRHWGALDIMIANAGTDPGPGYLKPGEMERRPENWLENYRDDRWHETVRISLDAVFFTARAAARHMRPQRSGRIIIITSIAALRPSPNAGVAYAAAKAGAAQATRGFALELAGENILVNAIAPGPFATGVVAEVLRDKTFGSEMRRRMPLGRIALPEEIKGLALFLSSPASAYITGQQFVIDGGATLGS